MWYNTNIGIGCDRDDSRALSSTKWWIINFDKQYGIVPNESIETHVFVCYLSFLAREGEEDRSFIAPYGSETSSQGSAAVAYTFTDKEKDNTGFIYFGARFYDPEVGRFISADPAEDGANWYAYCNDNPVRFVDPDGLRVGDNDNGGWDGSGYDGDSESTSYRNNGYQYGGNSGSSGGSGSHSSSSSNDRIANIMGNVLPGSASYGNAINSFQNGDYLDALGWTFAGAAEEFAFLCSFGQFGSVRKGLSSIARVVDTELVGLNFTKTAAIRMENPDRAVPVQTLMDAIKSTKGLPDPQKSSALMHYTTMTKNGQLYNLEVLYNKATNTVYHFMYTRDAIGPLPRIK
ncbi:RHS repeat-associated core domain-containing protein [Hydrogenispora ethanolica]|uniref:RHS repeat-associated core domain-containing protein n=1 Tax=Hydrogenispora ethanolica TaxID=1082276 RepID=UPI001FB2C0D7|nr:RHS repeat-associated core domain-containing protein [Hydrogenispora ethanolica]